MWAAPLGAFGAIAFHRRKIRPRIAGVARKAGRRVLRDLHILHRVVFGPIAAFCGFSLLKLIRYVWEELLVCCGDDIIGDSTSADHHQA